MATRPTAAPEWASDTLVTGGPDTGLELKETPDPSAGVIAQGLTPGTPLFAPRFNWLANLFSRWNAYFAAIIDTDENLTYQVAKTDGAWHIPGCDLKPGISALDGSGAYVEADPLEAWRPGTDNILYARYGAGLGPGGRDLLYPSTFSICESAYNEGVLPIYAPLHNGYILTSVDFFVTMGLSAATADDRIQVSYGYWDVSTGLIVRVDTAPCANTTADQTVTLSGLTSTSNRANRIPVLLVRASKNAPTNLDMFRGAQIHFTYQGPRAV